MKIKINVELEGNEIIQYFLDKLKENNITPAWKEGNSLPSGVKLLVTNKDNKEIEISPEKIKVVYNN